MPPEGDDGGGRPREAPSIAVFKLAGDSGGAGAGGGGAKGCTTEEVVAATSRLWAAQPVLERELLSRLLAKCRGVASLRGRRVASVLDAAEATCPRNGRSTMATAEEEAAAACAHFVEVVQQAMQVPRGKFSIARLLDLQQAGARHRHE